MDNHWHLVVRPETDRALAQFMGWIGVTHVRRHHQHYHTRGGGHLYQGRYKSFPVQDDRHFLTVCRYVEANPLRAAMVARATDWRWSGLSARGSSGGGRRGTGKPLKLSTWPVDRPAGWVDVLERSLKPDELQRLRTSVNRGRPFGDDAWTRRTAARLGLQFTLRDPGRPKKGKR